MRRAAGLVIRPATPADVAALAAIIDAAFAPYVPLIGRRPQPMSLDVAAAVASRTVLVAEDAGVVLGGLVADLSSDEAFVDTVAVAPAAHGRGIGRALMADVERIARRAGAVRMTLYTNALMAGPLELYPKLGYVVTGRDASSGFDRVNFAKRLGPRIATRAPVDGLYGRRRVHGHGLDPSYDRCALDLEAPADLPARVRMEVGFGAGEHLLDHARRAPDVLIIGVEPFETGMARAVRAVAAEGIGNVRLHLGDARRVLDWLPDASLEQVDVLYPDPWPKPRHWKRRFVSMDGLDRLARVLRPGSELRVASDIPAYVEWTRVHAAAHPLFALAGEGSEPWTGWPGTRYEAKALREGRTPRYLTLLRS